MAIIAVQRDRPEKEEKVDPLDRILKGLQIASNIYGIKTASEQSDLNKVKLELAKQQQAAGVTGAEQAQRDEGFKSAGLVTQEDLSKDYTEVNPDQFKAKYGDQFPLTRFDVATRNDPDNPRVAYAIPTKTLGLISNLKLKEQDQEFKAGQLLKKEQLASVAEAKKDLEKKEALTAKSKSASGDQFKAKGFADRMTNSNKIINNLMEPNSGFDRTDWWEATKAKTLGTVGAVGEPFKSEPLKMWEQAQRDFTNAILREESGAAIAPSEFDSAERQYFPSAGDTPKLIAQKKLNREIVIRAMERRSLGDITLEQEELLARAEAELRKKPTTTLIGGFAPPNTSLIGAPKQSDNKNFLQQYLSE